MPRKGVVYEPMHTLMSIVEGLSDSTPFTMWGNGVIRNMIINYLII